MIVERDAAPVRADARARAADLRAHFGCHSDGVLLLSAPARRALRRARCGSSTPTARRPSCRATARARRSSTCAVRAGPTRDEFSIETAAGEVRPTITRRAHLRGRDGTRAACSSADFPPGGADGRGTVTAGGRELRVPARQHRQPAVRDRGRRGARASSTSAAIGPPIEHSELFPNRTNVVVHPASTSEQRVRARIFERGVGETLVVGHRRIRRGRGGGAARRARAR